MTPSADPGAATDEDLVARAQIGDHHALEALLRRHYARVLAICRRLAGNEADAADAAQEALIAISRGLPRFDGRARFPTWAHRVATNACLDEMRRRGRRPIPVDDEAIALDDPARAGRGATDGAAQVGDRLDIGAALARLPLEFRAPIVLRDLCDFSYAEIGDTLGIRPGTVRSRISRGRAALAPLLAPGNQTDRTDVEQSEHT